MTDIIMTINEILDFAIQNEQNASDLYVSLADKAQTPAARKEYLQLAAEEKKHRNTLEKVKTGQMLTGIGQQVQDIDISDFAVDILLEEDADFQSILQFAIRQEEEAFRLYSTLSAITPAGEAKELLHNLAQEEVKHKLYFERVFAEHSK